MQPPSSLRARVDCPARPEPAASGAFAPMCENLVGLIWWPPSQTCHIGVSWGPLRGAPSRPIGPDGSAPSDQARRCMTGGSLRALGSDSGDQARRFDGWTTVRRFGGACRSLFACQARPACRRCDLVSGWSGCDRWGRRRGRSAISLACRARRTCLSVSLGFTGGTPAPAGARVPFVEMDKGKKVVPPLEKGKEVVLPLAKVPVRDHQSSKRRNYGHYHEESGPSHFCKVILTLKLESLPMPMEFTKHFPVVPAEFKLKTNTGSA
uniref:Uncharacterized protein n=1 Tax=Triticum aestivum TaxID=4565 RepID=A0A077RZP8_WHEAT|nr:unnamed protein product [Triticum aestivum]